MTTQRKQGIRRSKLDAVFATEETRKSNLILEANLLKAQGQHQDAADRFAEAAQIEERLSKLLLQKGLLNKYLVHRFSALSCWAQAGNVYQAIAMGEDLLRRTDLPENLRQDVEAYVRLLQTRRARWFVEFAPQPIVAASP